jgi:hypothetical protein
MLIARRLHKTVPELLATVGGVDELADWLGFFRLETGEPLAEKKPDTVWTAKDIQLILDMSRAKARAERDQTKNCPA